MKQAHEDIVHRARKISGNAIDEPLFQLAGAPIFFTQFNSDEHQDAFDKYGLPNGPDVPDGLFGVAPAARIVVLTAAARLDSPKINPGDNGWIFVLAGERAKCWKTASSIDDEYIFGGHGW